MPGLDPIERDAIADIGGANGCQDGRIGPFALRFIDNVIAARLLFSRLQDVDANGFAIADRLGGLDFADRRAGFALFRLGMSGITVARLVLRLGNAVASCMLGLGNAVAVRLDVGGATGFALRLSTSG